MAAAQSGGRHFIFEHFFRLTVQDPFSRPGWPAILIPAVQQAWVVDLFP